jgi:hypothetical protein
VKGDVSGSVPSGKVIYRTYKRKEHKAWVRTNGRIRFKGKIYDTPSAAGMAIVKRRTCNGWGFWKYKDKNGELVPLASLRK